MMAAAHGADALGVDVAPTAIAQARRKAAERGSAARFEVADVLDLGQLGLTFDTVVDSGVFHVFDDGDRVRYVASLASVMRPGATCYLLCFSDRQPGTIGPAPGLSGRAHRRVPRRLGPSAASRPRRSRSISWDRQAQAWLAMIERSGRRGALVPDRPPQQSVGQGPGV